MPWSPPPRTGSIATAERGPTAAVMRSLLDVEIARLSAIVIEQLIRQARRVAQRRVAENESQTGLQNVRANDTASVCGLTLQ